MRVKTYTEALRFARCAGEDAAKRRMRKAGRDIMTASDHDHAVEVMQRMLADLGYDTQGWIALAGLPRNAPPEEPIKRKRSKPRRAEEPVQLCFAFA